ncbi:MAG: tRNA dihydrouridine synthase DusB [Enterobacterales bacterium]|nr:tRNA dihydrouridine synthase DusB [Enterobacterales bacterium]
MQLGKYHFETPIILAPMAGVTDAPFRDICLAQGADIAVHEMVAVNPDLRNSRKSQMRLKAGDVGFKWVQIVGSEPMAISEGARYNADLGADAIDINMGCPAKKVCKKAAGSALLADLGLVEEILASTVAAVDIPVTVKIRTGTDSTNINAVKVATIAERVGVQCVSIHGRTRADRFRGEAEYRTIAAVRDMVSIPIIANGDISSPEKALTVLTKTQADGLMIGRAAYGNPWIFSEIKSFLKPVNTENKLTLAQKIEQILTHIKAIHNHYGSMQGVRIARKHIGWYLETFQLGSYRKQLNTIDSAEEQLNELHTILLNLALPQAS